MLMIRTETNRFKKNGKNIDRQGILKIIRKIEKQGFHVYGYPEYEITECAAINIDYCDKSVEFLDKYYEVHGEFTVKKFPSYEKARSYMNKLNSEVEGKYYIVQKELTSKYYVG